jgi:polar amino acid transport system substrate-binding protein
MDRVTVAYLDEPPFCIPASDGEPIGADMEVARRVLTGAEVDSVEYALTTFPELIPGLLDGRWQMTTAMFITPERSKIIAYSRPIWAAPDGFIVRAGDADRLTNYEAIGADPNAVLAVVTGQVQYQTALRVGVPTQRIIEFPDQDAAVEAVRRGQADASASTAIGNHAYVQLAADPALVAITDRPVAPRGPVALGAFAFNQTATDLISAVDRALESYLGSPDHLALMARHGFSAEQLEPIFC